MSKRGDYNKRSKTYDNDIAAAGSDTICALIQFYCERPLKSLHVLDAGCGTGNYAKVLIEHGVEHLTLLDASHGMLEVARRKLSDDIEAGKINKIVHESMPPIPFADECFDVVMFNLVLNHLDKLGDEDFPGAIAVLKEAKRVLRPGGVVVISTILKSTAANSMWTIHLDKTLGERCIQGVPSLEQFEKMFLAADIICMNKINILGADIFPNYKDAKNHIENYLDYLSASACERDAAYQRLGELEQNGELPNWIQEHDSANSSGLQTIIVCRAKPKDEKKFHHCVLVVSPFFDHALNDNFLENQTGTIELRNGTPLTIEMAIMFLYGKIPKFTLENIESMIDLAEFLLFPNLKSACINWINTVTITEENCMHLLQVSSIYDFEITNCIEYLMGHMPEMLHHSHMVNLCNESAQYLFSERKLSYVPMDDKVNFLVRWTNSQPARRNKCLKELIEMLDFHEVSKKVLDELKTNSDVCAVIDLENIVSNVGNDIGHLHRVLVMKGDYNSFLCLDLERGTWYRLNSEAYMKEIRLTYFYEIAGASGVDSEIYLMHRNHSYLQSQKVHILNLEENVCKTYDFFYEDNCHHPRNIQGYCIIGDLCIAYENALVKTNIQTRKDTAPRDLPRCLPNDGLLEQEIEETESIKFNTATLYSGYIKDESIKLSPLLSFKDENIKKICINKMLSVAVLFDSREIVSLFDLVDYKMEMMHLQTEYNDRLVQTDDGFIIYDNKRCICLTSVSIGPSLPTKFQTKNIPLEIKDLYENKYTFCGSTWYHFYRKKYGDHFIFESASHTDIMSKCSIENVNWKDLPLPSKETKCYGSTIKDNLFQIRLPKSKLRCVIDCPHCHLRPENSECYAFEADYESEDDYFDDDSEEYDDFSVYCD